MTRSRTAYSPEDFSPFVLRPDRYELYRELRQSHPVFYSARFDVWVLSRFDDVQAVARNWRRSRMRTASTSTGWIG